MDIWRQLIASAPQRLRPIRHLAPGGVGIFSVSPWERAGVRAARLSGIAIARRPILSNPKPRRPFRQHQFFTEFGTESDIPKCRRLGPLDVGEDIGIDLTCRVGCAHHAPRVQVFRVRRIERMDAGLASQEWPPDPCPLAWQVKEIRRLDAPTMLNGTPATSCGR